jgi:ribosomal protein S18 acetylase RimI-like enzyme
MSYGIVPIAEEHIVGFRAALDSVARELRYLAFLEAPPIDDVREFVRANMAAGAPQFVAIADGNVVDWCDVLPKPRPAMRHSGVLGMGVIAEYRGRGIGKALIEAALGAAKAKGLTRIELTVRVDNARARGLYEALGFGVEGFCRRYMRINGEYYDSYLMALVDGTNATSAGLSL